MTKLQPHQQRVVDEKAELDAKLLKLADFIVLNPLFKQLPDPERARLHRQHAAMAIYSGILKERIEAF